MDAIEKPSRRRIYLLRHGEVSYFDREGKPFRSNAVPLNAEGRAQADAAARELAKLPFDKIMTSDLPRCVETAAILAATRSIQPEVRPEFREIQPGRLAEIPQASVENAFLGAFSASIERDTKFLGGETFGSLIDRVMGGFLKLLRDDSWRLMLMVAHGGVNRVIISHALCQGLQSFAALEQDACCINVVDVDSAGRFIVRLVNYTPYNSVKTGLHMTTMEQIYKQYRGRGAKR